MADKKETPVPAAVQAKMQQGLRQRYAIATQGLDKPKGNGK